MCIYKLAKSIPNQVLSFLKSFYPKANVAVVARGITADCSDDKFCELIPTPEPVVIVSVEKHCREQV
jgi:hypothetical protein